MGEWVENRCDIARWIGLGGVEESAPGNYEMTSQCLSVTSSPRRFRVLLLVPALILTAVYTAVKLASGPYFLSANFDPDYVYLFNALNIAVGLAPVHTDHPGTPVQLLGALWIKMHNAGASDVDTAVNTIANSEAWLAQMNLTVFILLLGAVAVGCSIIYRKSREVLPALLYPAGLAFLGGNIYCLGRFNPEPVLLFISLGLGLLIYRFCFPNKRSEPDSAGSSSAANSPLVFTLLTAFLVATGLATKLSFLPLALLPAFLIRGWRYKLVYFLFLLCFLAMWLLPDYRELERMARWLRTLVTHAGRYGSGAPGLLDIHSYIHNVITLALKNLPYILLIAGSFVLAVYGHSRTRTLGPHTSEQATAPAGTGQSSPTGILMAVSGCQLLQFLMTCKYEESRHLVPGMGLASLNLLLFGAPSGFAFAKRWLATVTIVLLLTGATFAGVQLIRLRQKTIEHLGVFEAGQSYAADARRIYGYGASSPFYAWYFGNSFSGWHYGGLLSLMVPGSDRIFFYSNFAKAYLNFRGLVSSNEVFQARGPIIFQTPPFGVSDPIYAWPSGLKLTEKFGTHSEKIYLLDPGVPQ
jgi:hypothetical protein